MTISYRIEQMVEQIGPRNLFYTGFNHRKGLLGNDPNPEASPKISKVLPNGLIDSDCYLSWEVNVTKGTTWKMFIALEPNDTYTVRLWKSFRQSLKTPNKPFGEVVEEQEAVYADSLAPVIRAMYDRALQKYNNGFFNI